MYNTETTTYNYIGNDTLIIRHTDTFKRFVVIGEHF